MYYDTESRILQLFGVDKVELFKEDDLLPLRDRQHRVLDLVIEKHRARKFLQVRHLMEEMKMSHSDSSTVLTLLTNRGLLLKTHLNNLYLKFGYMEAYKPRLPTELFYAVEEDIRMSGNSHQVTWKKRLDATAGGSGNPNMYIALVAMRDYFGNYHPAYSEIFKFKIPEEKSLVKITYAKNESKKKHRY